MPPPLLRKNAGQGAEVQQEELNLAVLSVQGHVRTVRASKISQAEC